jgi:pimeloyl-ACP methyl ester carboxylesterase
MSFPARSVAWMLAVWLGAILSGRADAPLHRDVLVFIPGYEASDLFDPTLKPPGDKPPCVWGSVDAVRESELYFALRMPNPLVAQPMLSAGPMDVYGAFVDGMTDDHDAAPHFHPYTEGADFFIFAYDWRQEIAGVLAPLLAQALDQYARVHEEKTGIPAPDTRFIVVAHSMGGLVVRTLLSQDPPWAARLSALYLVGTPNLGSVKAIKTIVAGPGSLRQNAIDFPASLLSLLPNNVDSRITKLVAITRPSLYELLPVRDPRWECVAADGSRTRISALDILNVGPWEPYWPTAEAEKKLFLDGWLKEREGEGRKQIDLIDWEFCQDPDYGPLQHMLVQAREWRLKMGSLSYTDTLLTRPGEASRLKLVIGTGLQTPTGLITEGAHDFCTARYTYAPDNDGDETVTGSSVLDDLHPAANQVKLLTGVTHGRLMIDPQCLGYLYQELSRDPLITHRAETAEDEPAPVFERTRLERAHLAPGSSVP